MVGTIRKEDWERFRSSGAVPARISDTVLGSWVRSQEQRGIEGLAHAPSVAADELFAIRDRNARLRQAAQGAIRHMGQALRENGAMLLLTDPQGVVMEAVGDPRVLSRGEENHLFPGGYWHERAIGTNAIGTALHVGQPVTITGAEHFCEAIQRWFCAAAPVRDPRSGEVLGVVDISGPADQAFAPVAAMAVSLALQIEEALRSAGLEEHHRLVEALLARRSFGAGDEVVVFDRYGQEVWVNGAGGLPGGRGARLRGLAGGQSDARSIAERMRLALPKAGVDLVEEQGEALGVVVTLRKSRSRAPAPSDPAVTLDQIAAVGPKNAAFCATALERLTAGTSLLVEGAPGTGKETLARALHAASPLAARCFELVDCSRLSADALRADPLEGSGLADMAAVGGTLCLDEPGETPPAVQRPLAHLLADLSEGPVPLQVVALSSASLAERVTRGLLHRDLFARLAGEIVRLPDLAGRPAEIEALSRRFAELAAQEARVAPLRFTRGTRQALASYGWPGNRRELRNVVELLSANSTGRLIDVADLPPAIAAASADHRGDRLREREREEILKVVAETGGNLAAAARRLGIARSTLYLKLDQYGVSRG